MKWFLQGWESWENSDSIWNSFCIRSLALKLADKNSKDSSRTPPDKNSWAPWKTTERNFYKISEIQSQETEFKRPLRHETHVNVCKVCTPCQLLCCTTSTIDKKSSFQWFDKSLLCALKGSRHLKIYSTTEMCSTFLAKNFQENDSLPAKASNCKISTNQLSSAIKQHWFCVLHL